MGPRGRWRSSTAVSSNAADPAARHTELVDEYTERFTNLVAAERGFVDDVIDSGRDPLG